METLARTLPASWFRSPALYQLERRAVFLKSWHLLGPVTRFLKEPVSYEIAQVKLWVKNEGLGALNGIVVYPDDEVLPSNSNTFSFHCI